MKINCFCFGPPAVGKTELGLRFNHSEKTSSGSTNFFQVFSHELTNFFHELKEEKLFVNGETIDGLFFDYSGQINDVEEFGPSLLKKCNGSIIYVMKGKEIKDNLRYIQKLDEDINELYNNHSNKTLPQKVIYISQTLNNDSLIKLDNAKKYDYITRFQNNELESIEQESLNSILEFSKEAKTAVFIGESIGPNPPELNPYIYLIKDFNKLLKNPIRTDFHAPVSACLIFPRLYNKRKRRYLEDELVEYFRDYEVI